MPKIIPRTLHHLLHAAGAAIFAVFLMIGPAASQADLKAPSLKETIADSSLSGSYLAAQVAEKENDDAAAVGFYERAVALDPGSNGLKRALFLALTANGRIADAVDIARKLPQVGDQADVIRLVLAVDALRQKSWSKVGELLKKPTSGDFDRVIEQLLSAWAMFGAGEGGKAVDTARSVDGPDWVKVVANYHAGLIAAASGNDAEAVKLLQAATSNEVAAAVLSETYLRALEALVRSQVRLGKTDDARKTLEKGVGLLPGHPPFATLAKALDEGKPLTPLIVSAQQGGAELFYNVGAAISRQGGASFAQSYLQLADYLHPGSDVVALALANVFEKQNNNTLANKYYERISQKSSYWRYSRLQYALNLNDLKKVDEAESTLRELIKEEPSDLTARITLGAVLSQHEKFKKAAQVYDEAVAGIDKPTSHDWNVFYRRGIAYERLKEWDKAEPNFKKALELSPNQPDVLNYLGYSWIDMGIHLDEGLKMVRKAVELKPRSGFIVDSLGWAYFRLGRYDDAVRELEHAVDLMPQDAVVNDHLGDAYWKVGRKLEATFQWNHALADKPEPDQEAKIKEKLKHGLVEKNPATAETSQ